MSRQRGGFTLIELLVVAVLGGLLLLSTYQVLITNQRTYTSQNEKIEGQQITRAALDALAGELREINPVDLLTMSTSYVTFRGSREFGLVCNVNLGNPPVLTVLKVTEWMEVGDSVVVYADNQVGTASDDEWIYASVTATDTTKDCSGDPAQTLTFSSQQPLFLADTVQVGAPVRAFDKFLYGHFIWNSENWVGRYHYNGSSWSPIVGPIPSSFAPGAPSLEFLYLDGAGSPTTVAADVDQIELRIRMRGEATRASGQEITDSLVTRVYLRN